MTARLETQYADAEGEGVLVHLSGRWRRATFLSYEGVGSGGSATARIRLIDQPVAGVENVVEVSQIRKV